MVYSRHGEAVDAPGCSLDIHTFHGGIRGTQQAQK